MRCSNPLLCKSPIQTLADMEHPYVDVSSMNHFSFWLFILIFLYHYQIKNAGKTNLVFDLLRVPFTPRCQWSAIDCKCFCYAIDICFNLLTFQTLWQTPFRPSPWILHFPISFEASACFWVSCLSQKSLEQWRWTSCFFVPGPRLFIINTGEGNHPCDPLLMGLIAANLGIEYCLSSISGLVYL